MVFLYLSGKNAFYNFVTGYTPMLLHYYYIADTSPGAQGGYRAPPPPPPPGPSMSGIIYFMVSSVIFYGRNFVNRPYWRFRPPPPCYWTVRQTVGGGGGGLLINRFINIHVQSRAFSNRSIKTFMMTSNWKNPFVFKVYIQIFQA